MLDDLLDLVEDDFVAAPPAFKGSLDYIDQLPTDSLSNLSVNGRDAVAITNALSDSALPRRTNLLVDNRRYNPTTDFDVGDLGLHSSRIVDQFRPTNAVRRQSVSRLPIANPRRSNVKIRSALSFANPYRVGVCVRRHIRREVMHALGLSGAFYRPHRFTPYSRVHC